MPCPTCHAELVAGESTCAACSPAAQGRRRDRRVLAAVVLAPLVLCAVTGVSIDLAVERQGTVSVDARAPYARLRLGALTCDQADDGLLDFFEEPQVDVAGRTLWAGEGFRTGTVADLSSVTCVIKGATRLEMLEDDQVDDDLLGGARIEPAPADGQHAFVDRAQTTRFTLGWRVEPVEAEARCAVLRLRTVRRSRSAAPGFSYVETITLLVDGKPARVPVSARLWPTPLALAIPFEGTCTLQLQVDVTRSGEAAGALITHLSSVETFDAADARGARSLVLRVNPPHEAAYVVRCDVVR